MKKQELALALYEIGCIRVGNFTLVSGKTSTVYIDLRQLVSYPAVLKSVAAMIWEKVKEVKVDRLCGVPYTALPIATTISILENKPMIMVRKEAKTYGTKKLIEGVFQPGDSCVLIEDLVTTGGSAIKVAKQLQEEGLMVSDIAVLLDREQGGMQEVSQAGFQLHAVFKITELLSLIKTANKFSFDEWNLVEVFLKELHG